MAYNVTLIPGDGIGPEVTEATRRVLEATGVPLKWDVQPAGEAALEKHGSVLPAQTLESIRKNKVALKGPITTPIGKGFRSVNVALRKELDLYACLRPCKLYPGVPSRYENVDLVVVRENTEDLYIGIEFEKGTPQALKLIDFIARENGAKIRPDSGFSIKMLSVTGSRRIVKFAFDYARANGRKKVTSVHKANIMKYTDGLFMAVSHEVAKEYPDIEFEDRLVDNMEMQLVRHPEQFDVIVAPNIYGDLLSELCAGLVGGMGVAPGANIGESIAVFEPTHGSAPKYAGLNKVSPMAMMFSGVLMLNHLGEKKAAQKLEKALADIIAEGKSVTYDLKADGDTTPPVGTSDVADAVIKKLKK